ncbi:MAG TPA: pyridoxal phosphate-dependent aminotransferase [Candidatus Polarisedimenticolia bacterium]|nr:pyridoxal phosphate-dependent aminotransferase [Candidatus Polarisedimenticolia bacterium]
MTAPLRLARRLEVVSVSPTLAVMMEAKALRAKGIDVVDFGPGEPDFNTPENVKAAGQRAIAENHSHYTDTAGIVELRRAIAERQKRLYGAAWSPDEVVTGVGGKNVLFLLAMSLFDPGDRVAIFSPYWVSFPEQVRMCGSEAVIVAGEPTPLGAVPRARSLEPYAGSLKAVIVNSPCNPTGVVIPPDEVERFVAFAERTGTILISDETYDTFNYGPGAYASFAAHQKRLGDRLVLVNSLSKAYAMTGWRVGYALGPKPIIDAMKKVQSHDASHTAAVAQAAALEAITGPQESVAAMREEYRRRRDALVPALNRVRGISCPVPGGAFYVFPDVTGAIQALGCATSVDLAKRLMSEVAVATVPGEAFGAPGHLRLSYALSVERSDEGVRRLTRILGEAKA